MQRNNVVFPAPEGPTIQRISSSLTVRLTSSRITRLPKLFFKFLTSNLVKDSSLVYVIGLGDLLRAGNVATSRDVTLIPLLLVGLIYLILVGICTLVLRQVEKRYSYFK